MNRQLRKRFLGAGVVVALAALILPFLMQGEGYKANQRLAENAKTRIPERPVAPARLDTQVPPPPADVREALVEPDDLSEPVAPPAPAPKSAVKPAPTEAVKPKPLPAPPASEVKVKALDKPLEKPAEKLTNKPLEPIEPKSAAKPAVPPVAAPLAPAPLAKPVIEPKNANVAGKPAESVPAAPVSAAAKEAWVIQLGSFTAEANAQKLLTQVQRAGVSAKVEQIEVKGSPVWRVSSQTYSSRAEADAALKVLQARQNLSGMVRPVR